jgi:hypothetical protein
MVGRFSRVTRTGVTPARLAPYKPTKTLGPAPGCDPFGE